MSFIGVKITPINRSKNYPYKLFIPPKITPIQNSVEAAFVFYTPKLWWYKIMSDCYSVYGAYNGVHSKKMQISKCFFIFLWNFKM